ncbi:unnamed protein product, partial [Ectocarpus sp. 6 AP-2014]
PWPAAAPDLSSSSVSSSSLSPADMGTGLTFPGDAAAAFGEPEETPPEPTTEPPALPPRPGLREGDDSDEEAGLLSTSSPSSSFGGVDTCGRSSPSAWAINPWARRAHSTAPPR